MKPTHKRKLKAYWNIEEKIRRIQCAKKIRRRRGGGDKYFFTLDDLLASESRAFQQEVACTTRRLLDNLRRRRKRDSYPQENFLIEVPEGAFPPEGAVYGKWLLLDELRNSNEPCARTFSFIRGGPAHMHERIWTDRGNESRTASLPERPLATCRSTGRVQHG